MTVDGVDDDGRSPGSTVTLSVPAGGSQTVSAAELESGDGLSGALGDGQGKWRLNVWSNEPIRVMNLLSSPTGHLTNLSSTPPDHHGGSGGRIHHVPLMPPASHGTRQGFIRIINRSAIAGSVEVVAIDDSGQSRGPITMALDGRNAVHFNSDDLEFGNRTKGLSHGVGAGQGSWRLVASSSLDLQVLSYIRTTDGFLTGMLDLVSGSGTNHDVPVFNPASNTSQVSILRLINPGTRAAHIEIAGGTTTVDRQARSRVLSCPQARLGRSRPSSWSPAMAWPAPWETASGSGTWRCSPMCRSRW